ncbi:hypothetical protein HYS31_00990 [Candidatus Woesearchaeota archaeon]|nr:hypothetical protein [Candidatus Woesearchaeota archaeon]
MSTETGNIEQIIDRSNNKGISSHGFKGRLRKAAAGLGTAVVMLNPVYGQSANGDNANKALSNDSGSDKRIVEKVPKGYADDLGEYIRRHRLTLSGGYKSVRDLMPEELTARINERRARISSLEQYKLNQNPNPQQQPQQKHVADKSFWLLLSALEASTIYDVETTFNALNRCERKGYICGEANPLMRPFVESGRPATYAIQHAINAYLAWSAYQWKPAGGRWWLPPLVVIGVHAVAGTSNLRVAR